MKVKYTEGELKLIAKSAGARVSYQWQQSADGFAWRDLPVTLQAKTTVNGLTPAERLYFRVRPILKDGAGNWSPTVSIIVK